MEYPGRPLSVGHASPLGDEDQHFLDGDLTSLRLRACNWRFTTFTTSVCSVHRRPRAFHDGLIEVLMLRHPFFRRLYVSLFPSCGVHEPLSWLGLAHHVWTTTGSHGRGRWCVEQNLFVSLSVPWHRARRRATWVADAKYRRQGSNLVLSGFPSFVSKSLGTVKSSLIWE